MSTRKTAHLVFGDYVVPGACNNSETWKARQLMARAIPQHCPEFLAKLEADVLPYYQGVASQEDLERVALEESPYARLSQIGAAGVARAIRKWARAFNAEVPWILDEAVRILRGWHLYPDFRKSRRWILHTRISVPNTHGGPLEFQFPAWEPSRFPWSIYRNDCYAAFDKELKGYEKKVRALAQSRGLVPVRRKYSPDNLNWFILYQFAGKSSEEIARNQPTKEPSTILKGIKTAAELLGWECLRGPHSRPNRKIRN